MVFDAQIGPDSLDLPVDLKSTLGGLWGKSMNSTSDEIFARLAIALAHVDQREKTWLAIGDALHALETSHTKALDGRPWHDVLQSFLEERGISVTGGHLNKVRRVHKFVRINVEPSVSDSDLTAPQVQFSALEMAERLHTLDHAAGIDALKDCIDGLKFGAMRDRYESFREARPELLPPRQRAWMRKRSEQEINPATNVAHHEVAQDASSDGAAVPSDIVQRLSEDFAQALWRAAYDKGRADAIAEVTEKEAMIQTLKTRIQELEDQRLKT